MPRLVAVISCLVYALSAAADAEPDAAASNASRGAVATTAGDALPDETTKDEVATSENTKAGHTKAGHTKAGHTKAGQTKAGQTKAGQTTTGNATTGNATTGNATAGNATGQATQDEARLRETAREKGAKGETRSIESPPDAFSVDEAARYYRPAAQRRPGALGGPPPVSLPDAGAAMPPRDVEPRQRATATEPATPGPPAPPSAPPVR